MRIIVPMAGMGKRLRPHTLTTPKPLIPVAGKPIVQHLVEDLAEIMEQNITEIAFVIGDFGNEVEKQLIQIAKNIGAEGSIHYQHEALGTAHAILCAGSALKGPVTVAFADTLFKADFKPDHSADGVLWVKKIDDPSQFGVVTLDEKNVINGFMEKPTEFVSDLAMIGIYYFKSGETLKKELEYLIENKIIKGGEYQLPDALRNMTEKGMTFVPGTVDEWLDCGNKNATVNTNQRMLEFKSSGKLISEEATIENSVIIPPCFIAKNVKLKNTILGPHVSVGEGSKIENSIIKNCIIQGNSTIENTTLENSMIGNFTSIASQPIELSIGDYNSLKI